MRSAMGCTCHPRVKPEQGSNASCMRAALGGRRQGPWVDKRANAENPCSPIQAEVGSLCIRKSTNGSYLHFPWVCPGCGMHEGW